MDGGNAPYYWMIVVAILSVILILKEFKKN